MAQQALPKGELLSRMIAFATRKHNGQFDKSGMPYILHPLAVMYLLNTDDEERQCMAVGHDLLEDTDTTYEELHTEGFTARIIAGIRCLTRTPGENEVEYRAKVKSNLDSVEVKKADLRHNSDITRLKGVTERDVRRTVKYHEFYLELIKINTTLFVKGAV